MILDEGKQAMVVRAIFLVYQYSSIKPDILTTAKGLGNGFPVVLA